ncbi:hypothetical protein, partial [Rhodopirellula bahusiensis]|uniref:hypothetical protein n=1 Tax=Rhodopirellula bahusiensis TaxID=2014065 RepID=UPI003262DE9C
MLTTEEAAQNLIDYDAALTTSLNNVGEIRDEVGDALDTLETVDRVIEKIEGFRDEIAGFNDDIGKLRTVLSLMEKAAALRPIARVGESIVDSVQDVLTKFETELNKAIAAVDDSAIKGLLDRVVDAVSTFDGQLAAVEGEISDQQAAFGTIVSIAANAATLAEEPIQLAGTLVEQPLALVNTINELYFDNDNSDLDSVKELLTDFSGDLPSGDFSAFLSLEAAMDDVFGALDFIRKPLDAVSKVLEPIEPLLSAVDFVASLTVDPVIEFVLDNLGIDQVIDAAEAKVQALLPDADALNGFDGVFNAMEEALARYDPLTSLRTYDHDRDDTTDERADPFGLGEWVVE